jgi:hypothetical protein
MIQVMLTPAAGKRLIAKAMVLHPAVQRSLESGMLVIIAGTTNGYVAEEILRSIGQFRGFSRRHFFRGIVLPPQIPEIEGKEFPGDVVIVNGKWQKGKTIFDVANDIQEGDVILKGASALDVTQRRAAVFIGDSKGGTTLTLLQAVIGRRAKLIIPVGLEKRITDRLDDMVLKINSPGVEGPRLMPLQGEVVTEIESISLISGAKAELFAAGGVAGAEGCVWLAVSGTRTEERRIKEIVDKLSDEKPFTL